MADVDAEPEVTVDDQSPSTEDADAVQAYPELRRRVAIHAAAPMFWLSVLFLANTAALIVVWVDVPRVTEAYLARKDGAELVSLQPQALFRHRAEGLGHVLLAVMEVLWPVFVVEFLVIALSYGARPRFSWLGLMSLFFPPLRMAMSHPEMGGRIWLPRLGWFRPDDQVREKLERVFGLPMIMIALMIVPILLVEFQLREHVVERPWLRILLHVSTGTIWFAFALEFILMCSVAPKKLQYCKQHWVDLAIIVLPLISFMRSLRLLRLAKVQQLTRMGRVYRLRGLVVKAIRAMLLFEGIYLLFRISPERRVARLKETLAEKEQEVKALKRQIEVLESKMTREE